MNRARTKGAMIKKFAESEVDFHPNFASHIPMTELELPAKDPTILHD